MFDFLWLGGIGLKKKNLISSNIMRDYVKYGLTPTAQNIWQL